MRAADPSEHRRKQEGEGESRIWRPKHHQVVEIKDLSCHHFSARVLADAAERDRVNVASPFAVSEETFASVS